MKGQLKVSTPAQYIAKLKGPRKSEVAALDKLIRKATKFKPFIQSGMLAYGHCRLKYADGREADWFRDRPGQQRELHFAVYLRTRGTADVVEHYKKALPKANIGKCCVRFKRIGRPRPCRAHEIAREGAKTRREARRR